MQREIKIGNVNINDEARRNILQVVANSWVSPGPFVKEFEEKFAAMHGCKYGVMVNSGTDALRIALAALKEKYGWTDQKEIIVPALTFVATVNIILQNNLKPVFVDVDPSDLLIDVNLIEKEITSNTVGMIPVHLFGQIADMYRIPDDDLFVIEDSCETMGVRYIDGKEGQPNYAGDRRNQIVGSFGDIACFSTYSCHLIQTGVGGIATTNNEELYKLMRSLMNHGRRDETRANRFVFDRIGHSCRPDEFQAAIGLSQLAGLSKAIDKRRENARSLHESLVELKEELWMLNPMEINRQKAWMMFPIIINDKSIDRDKFCSYLEDRGIETRPLFPLLTQPCYKNISTDKFYAERFPVALRASTHGFYVGCHPELDAEDMMFIAKNIKDALFNFSMRLNPVEELVYEGTE